MDMVDTAMDTGERITSRRLHSFTTNLKQTQYSIQMTIFPISINSDPLSSKQETKSHDGTTHGGYSYVDANGHLQSVKYVADPHNGFQIVSATNLPKGPAPVHAVAPVAYAAAPVAYAAAPVAVSHWGVPAYAHAHLGAPVPVQKTHEVLAAEAKHFQAHAEAKARLHHVYKRSANWAHTPIGKYIRKCN